MPEMNREEITKLEALYASNPEGRVFTHLAEAYRKAGEYERARSILEQGLTKHPAYASAHVVLGRVYADLNETEQANASFRHVLELDPHNLVALRSLGEIARSQGHTTEALHYFEELRHQDPSNNEIEGVIADLRRAESDSASAATAVEEQEAPAVYEEPASEIEAAAYESHDEPPAMDTLPGFEDSAPDYGDLVSPDIDLGWSETPSEDALPGDLADLAAQTESPAEAGAPVEFEPELPTFEAETEAEPTISAGIDLSDFEQIQETPEFTSTEDPWSMTMDAVEPEAAASEESPWDQQASEEQVSQEAEPDYQETETPEPAVVSFAHIESVTTVESWSEPEPEPEPEATPAPEPEPEPEMASEPEAPAPLVTETMAELYTEQGLYEQAAEVYRSLMAERPWDPDLPIRMAEAEAKARGGSMASPEPEPVYQDVAPAMSDQSQEESDSEEPVDSPWMAAQATAASAPTPYAWTEDAARDSEDEGPPISHYFQSLLSWRPGGVQAVAQASPESQPEPEPEVANFEPASATADVPAIIDLDSPVSEPEPAFEPEPWDAPAPEAPATAAAGNNNPVEAAFDEWFNSSDFGEAQTSPEPETESAEAQVLEPGTEGEDDDDLEMFRSWLQSLKK